MRTSLALFLAFFLSGAAPAGEGELDSTRARSTAGCKTGDAMHREVKDVVGLW